jgi:hypothetical protein
MDQLNPTPFSPTSSMDLGLNNPGRSLKFFSDHSRTLDRGGHITCRDRNSEPPEQAFGLILVQFHD